MRNIYWWGCMPRRCSWECYPHCPTICRVTYKAHRHSKATDIFHHQRFTWTLPGGRQVELRSFLNIVKATHTFRLLEQQFLQVPVQYMVLVHSYAAAVLWSPAGCSCMSSIMMFIGVLYSIVYSLRLHTTAVVMPGGLILKQRSPSCRPGSSERDSSEVFHWVITVPVIIMYACNTLIHSSI